MLDEPVELPEGTEVDLIPADEGDRLDDAERARLHAALERAHQQVLEGKAIDAKQVLDELRTRR